MCRRRAGGSGFCAAATLRDRDTDRSGQRVAFIRRARSCHGYLSLARHVYARFRDEIAFPRTISVQTNIFVVLSVSLASYL